MQSSYIGFVFNEIQKNFLNQFGCFKPGPCNRKFLAEQQYYLGKVTFVGTNTTGYCKQYPSINQRSVSGFPENLSILKNKIPEIYGFYNIHYDFKDKDVIFGGESDVIFSDNAGSITNYYQMMVMHDFSVNRRTSDQAHLFNIWSNPDYFVHYVDHLFFEWYMDGLISEIPIKGLSEGYDDETILRLSSIGELYGGLQNVRPRISFGVLDSYGETINMNAGDADNLETYKTRSIINTINGSPDIKGWKVDVKINSTVSYSGKPMEYINGNTFYHHSFRKNLVFDKSKSLKQLQFSISELSWNRLNFKSDVETYDTYIDGTLNVSRFHEIPVIVSLPFFKNSEALLETLSSVVTIDDMNLKDFTPIEPVIQVERFSGFVFNSSMPFMYSVVLKKYSGKIEGGRGYFSNLLTQDFFVPVFIATENFSYTDSGVSIVFSLYLTSRKPKNSPRSRESCRARISTNTLQ